MGPWDLEQILSCLPPVTDEHIHSGISDDATVYRVSPSLAVVQTVDFITPVLDDPYAFGAVAASNAIGDIYAMGARPVFALNIVEFPAKSLPLEILQEILRGGADKAREAGVSVTGGHSVEDNAPKYGMAVTGFVDPSRVVRKKGAQPGDLLFLTKPLGIGVVTTALGRGLGDPEVEDSVYRLMAHLNKGASEAMVATGVHACTDVTGFGLLGHLCEMLASSGVSARLHPDGIPVIERARELAEAGSVPSGAYRNYRYLRDRIDWSGFAGKTEAMLLCDPQTAGGLLISVPRERADRLQEALIRAGCPSACEIGRVTERGEKLVELVS